MLFRVLLAILSIALFYAATIAPFEQGLNHLFYWLLSGATFIWAIWPRRWVGESWDMERRIARRRR